MCRKHYQIKKQLVALTKKKGIEKEKDHRTVDGHITNSLEKYVNEICCIKNVSFNSLEN